MICRVSAVVWFRLPSFLRQRALWRMHKQPRQRPTTLSPRRRTSQAHHALQTKVLPRCAPQTRGLRRCAPQPRVLRRHAPQTRVLPCHAPQASSPHCRRLQTRGLRRRASQARVLRRHAPQTRALRRCSPQASPPRRRAPRTRTHCCRALQASSLHHRAPPASPSHRRITKILVAPSLLPASPPRICLGTSLTVAVRRPSHQAPTPHPSHLCVLVVMHPPQGWRVEPTLSPVPLVRARDTLSLRRRVATSHPAKVKVDRAPVPLSPV
jgi:hypothetical protein